MVASVVERHGRRPPGNDPARTLENARLEGISEPETRIELCTGDMCTMPFDDASFDVIVSSWAIHNVQQAADRAQCAAPPAGG